MNLVDTSGWLEYFADSAQARHFAPAIENVRSLLVPSVVIYEVFKKVALAFDEGKAFAAVAQLKLGRVIDVDESVAVYAGKLSMEHKLPMADAFIYAIALLNKATVYTQDAHFEGLPSVRYFAKPV